MPEPLDQRRLAAIMIADVVGYSRMMAADEAGTFAALKTRRETVLVPQLVPTGAASLSLWAMEFWSSSVVS